MQVFKRKIKVEIVGTDVIIEDADISVSFTKTDEVKAFNECEIVIYNMSDDTYNRIKKDTLSVKVYTDIDGTGYILCFDGLLRSAYKTKKSTASNKSKKTKRRKKAISSSIPSEQPQIKREAENNDIATTIYLEDGRKSTYFNNYINKSYKGKVTNIFILEDILSSLKKQNSNIKISANTSSLDEYTYINGVSLSGTLKNVLTKICKTGNAYCTVQDDVILISSENVDKEGAVYAYTLDGNTCLTPEIDSKNQIRIQAPFIQSINPFNFVNLNFKDYNGLYQVKKIESKIDNFGQDYETNVIVKVNQ